MKLVWGLVVMMLAVLFGGTASANEMPFSVRVMQATEQRSETTGYFDLVLAPDQVKEVQVLLTNDTEKPLTVDIKSAQATTNRNGVVDYETAQSGFGAQTHYTTTASSRIGHEYHSYASKPI